MVCLAFVLHRTTTSLTCAPEQQQFTKCKKPRLSPRVPKSLRMYRQAEMRVPASYTQ
jgi:hypothetical protein